MYTISRKFWWWLPWVPQTWLFFFLFLRWVDREGSAIVFGLLTWTSWKRGGCERRETISLQEKKQRQLRVTKIPIVGTVFGRTAIKLAINGTVRRNSDSQKVNLDTYGSCLCLCVSVRFNVTSVRSCWIWPLCRLSQFRLFNFPFGS